MNINAIVDLHGSVAVFLCHLLGVVVCRSQISMEGRIRVVIFSELAFDIFKESSRLDKEEYSK